MDRLIKRFDYIEGEVLNYCQGRGVAYQREMTRHVKYDEAYFNKCLGYEGKEIADKINTGRIALVGKYHKGTVLDIGVGSGEFIKRRTDTFGYDINPSALQWLADNGCYSDALDGFDAYTFWDVIEHLDTPEIYFKRIPKDAYLFCSIPIIDRLDAVPQWKHYRPDEHLYYFTKRGFTDWMALWGFRFVERQKYEIDAGRKDIYSYVFKKDLPDYLETLQQYVCLHEDKYYGGSSILYLDYFADIIREDDPMSILDYGCGRSELADRFWKDGERIIEKYDPAISQYSILPDKPHDMVFCCDVMEHINMRDVDRVFKEIKSCGDKVVFVIHLGNAKTHLPDQRNAHVTVLKKTEWIRWIADVFGKCAELPDLQKSFPNAFLCKTW